VGHNHSGQRTSSCEIARASAWQLLLLRARRARTRQTYKTGAALTLMLLLTMSSSCTKQTKKSGLRDLVGDAGMGAPPSQMKIKYSFNFLGSSGKKFPIYMTAVIDVSQTQTDAVWNSVIDSDGGLIAAISEPKTLKPDKSLPLKSASAAAPTEPSALVFVSGNPEMGRGLSVTLKKVTARGAPAWKAVALSYYGYSAQIEDSTNIKTVQSSSGTAPAATSPSSPSNPSSL